MNKLLSIENIIKAGYGIVLACGVIYRMEKNQALTEQKLDMYIAMNMEKEHEARMELAEIKATHKEFNKRMEMLSERIVKIYAVMPKKWYGEIEDENN